MKLRTLSVLCMLYTVGLCTHESFSQEPVARDSAQSLLPLGRSGVRDFLLKHPEYDGRGTIIFIFDTGVDVGADGLTKTTTGETKVIDVVDLSRQGDVSLSPAEKSKNGYTALPGPDGNSITASDIDALSQKAVDGRYLLGAFDEERLKNSKSGAQDINGNGKGDDKYLIAVFRTSSAGETYWTAYIDTDMDGQLQDEKPLRSYREKFDTFQIPNPVKSPRFTFAVNIYPESSKINIFFDDGAHGTHVAGIASGYGIGRIEGFNGVAPGARLIAVKISDNSIGGITLTESMKSAYLFADSLSRQLKQPCIINMSFGIGSVVEGQADMEVFLENLLKNNPYLYVSTSNGNSGPGISSSGLPASTGAVFSSGAILTRETGGDVYGASLDDDIILHFSARGGEASKPDVCSPGACVSTVPNWSLSDKMWGTSMASPYTAGVMSLLLSAAQDISSHQGVALAGKAQSSGGANTSARTTAAAVPVPSQLLYDFIRQGAVRMPGYNHLDQGAGYINVQNAFEKMEKWLKGPNRSLPEQFSTSAETPNFPNHRSSNLYFRDGSFLGDDEQVRVAVKRVTPGPSKFSGVYNISSDEPWIEPVQKKLYMRDRQTSVLTLKLDKKKLSAPGLYTAGITGVRGAGMPEIEMLATVVIPYEFAQNKLEFKGEKLAAGKHNRYFIKVPPASGGLKISLKALGKKGQSMFRVFDPDGRIIFTSGLSSGSAGEQLPEENLFYGLRPGVYEVVVHGYFLSDAPASYDLSMDINRVEIASSEGEKDGKMILKKASGGEMNLVSYSEGVRTLQTDAMIIGYRKTSSHKLSGDERFTGSIILRRAESSKRIRIRLSKTDFNKLTDFAFLVTDKNGKAVETETMDYEDNELEIKNIYDADSTELFLTVIPAFTNRSASAVVNISETAVMSQPQQVSLSAGGTASVKLYPYVYEKIQYPAIKPEFYYPDGSVVFGGIFVRDSSDGEVLLEKEFVSE